MAYVLIGALGFGGAFIIFILAAMAFRVVVKTNDVHIVQSARNTISYGKDQSSGNVYYKWPAWMPRIGVRVIELPVSVFDVSLDRYAAYDKGRVPFVVDVLAFFRIADSNVAAQRVSSFDELKQQLEGILQGASRSIMAQAPIEEILEERAKYGLMFTEATNDQLKAWGVENVKNIELMDISDAQNSNVIKNIMAIKQSTIEKESRTQVAANQQAAKTAEINAAREVAMREQEAEQAVGVRTAEKQQSVGIAHQKAEQAIAVEAKETATNNMAVEQVKNVRAAEIEREVKVVQADQVKQTTIIAADATKQQTVIVAEGNLEQSKLHAQGIEVEGAAKGAAETAILMAPVNSQIALAKEIGENQGYQTYLVTLRNIEASQAVGIEQAKALAHAEIKVISNVGTPPEGIKNVMDLFSAKGGLAVGAALEAIASTPAGKAITDKLGVNGSGQSAHS